jgi:hypothetical protein
MILVRVQLEKLFRGRWLPVRTYSKSESMITGYCSLLPRLSLPEAL